MNRQKANIRMFTLRSADEPVGCHFAHCVSDDGSGKRGGDGAGGDGRGGEDEFGVGGVLEEGEAGLEEDDGAESVDFEVGSEGVHGDFAAGSCDCEDAGVGDDDVEVGDVVDLLEGVDGLGCVAFAGCVELYEEDGAVGSFG